VYWDNDKKRRILLCYHVWHVLPLKPGKPDHGSSSESSAKMGIVSLDLRNHQPTVGETVELNSLAALLKGQI
jgi:hypothetical protein